MNLNHRERLQACVSGGRVDRVPVALWRHFPVDDQDPKLLAKATIEFQRLFDFDLVKVTPASSFCLKDWGVQDAWRGSTEGTRDYIKRVIVEPEDWYRLKILDPDKGFLSDQIQCIKIIVREIGKDVPIIQTIFNPISQAKNLVGPDKFLFHLRKYPEELHAGLKVIAETTKRFIKRLSNEGVDGIFFAVQHAQYNLLSLDEYIEFGRFYDYYCLENASVFWLNMLHLHGENIMFDLFVDYPVSVINWHDRDTVPTLAEGLEKFPGIVCGGLQREKSIVYGTPNIVIEEAQGAIKSTKGRRLMLGTGCVVPIIAPLGNIAAVRNYVESLIQ